MSLRNAKNTMTGRPCNRVEVVLGRRQHGYPGVTVYPNGFGYVCFTSASVVRQLIADLEVAAVHLESRP